MLWHDHSFTQMYWNCFSGEWCGLWTSCLKGIWICSPWIRGAVQSNFCRYMPEILLINKKHQMIDKNFVQLVSSLKLLLKRMKNNFLIIEFTSTSISVIRNSWSHLVTEFLSMKLFTLQYQKHVSLLIYWVFSLKH